MENLNLIACLAIILTISFCNGQIDPIVQESIDSIIENIILPTNHAPALGLSIVKDGQTIYSKGYGDKDVENSVQADNETLFVIGSISKSFTATILVKTLNENFPELGEAVLDTPISKLVPTYNFTLNDRFRSEATTARDLLAHKECSLPESAGTFFGATKTPSQLAFIQRYAPPICGFRTEFVYNNGHFVLASEIAAEISGVPYLTMLDDFFAQLGMTNTTYVKASDDYENMPEFAKPYYMKDGQLLRYNSSLLKRYVPMNAAGGIISSTNDMAKYLQFHLNLGRVGDTQVVPESVIKWLHKNSNPLPSIWKTIEDDKIYNNIGYCLGLQLQSFDGWQILGHGGFLPPFNSFLSTFPALNLGIFTTANGPGRFLPGVTQELLHLEIFNLLQGTPALVVNRNDTSFHKSEIVLFPTASTVASTQYSLLKKENKPFQAIDIIGHYGNGLSGEFDITQKLNASGEMELYMTYGDWGNGWIRPISNDTFAYVWDSDVVQDFYTQGYLEPPAMTFTYDGISVLIFSQDGVPAEIYYKNLRLEDLPAQPWSADSCGPEI